MSLWNLDYFMLKKVKVQTSQEETLTFPPNCLKECRQRTSSRKEAITMDNHCKNQVKQTGRNLEKSVKILLCVPLSLHGPGNIYQTFAFPSPCELPSFTLKSQTTTSNILFCLCCQVKMVFEAKASVILVIFCFPVSLPCIHAIKLLCDFLLLIYYQCNENNLEGQRKTSFS